MEEKPAIIIGRRLRFFRNRAKLSQLDLETATDMSPGALSRIENGAVNPTKETILQLAEVLGLSQIETEYTFGKRMHPVTTKDIYKALESVKVYYSKRFVYSYFIDDRYRVWGISKSLQKFLKLSDIEVESHIGVSLVDIVLESAFSKKFLDSQMYDETVTNLLEIFYAECGFMFDDEIIISTIEKIRDNKITSEIWANIITQEPISIYSRKRRIVSFHTQTEPIHMELSTFPLLNNNRFWLTEYTPLKNNS